MLRSLIFFAAAAALRAATQGPAAAPETQGALPSRYRLTAGPLSASGIDLIDAPVKLYRTSGKTSLSTAFAALSHSYGATFVLGPEIQGEVSSIEVRDGTLRDILDALAQSQGCFWERQGRIFTIKRNAVRFYQIDYPQMTRSAQGSSNVVLTAQTGTGGGFSGGTAAAQASLTSSASGTLGGASGSNQNDQTNISIQQQNHTTFWADVQAELTGLAEKGESVAVNKLAGLAIVTAPPGRQETFKALVEAINQRITQQVRIEAKVLEVDLNSQNQLGVDWTLAASKIGGISLSSLGTATQFSAIDGQTIVPSTISGVISTGKVRAAVSALSEQGDVHAVSNPSVVSLNNQTAFVKVGTEQTFFSLSNSTAINQQATAGPYSSTQNNYTQNAITIGTVLYVTPEVNSDGSVTVDVLPAISQLIGTDTSPDGAQTAPRLTIKSLSTIARLQPDQSIMIGGLIYQSTSTQTEKVPVLGDIPVIGKAFGTTGTVKTRSELVIFLTATRLP
jgi:MSHA type pilus biogenesis protein MshL